MVGKFTANRIRLIKARYARMSAPNLLSLLASVDTAREAELISKELDKRGIAHD